MGSILGNTGGGKVGGKIQDWEGGGFFLRGDFLATAFFAIFFFAGSAGLRARDVFFGGSETGLTVGISTTGLASISGITGSGSGTGSVIKTGCASETGRSMKKIFARIA